MNDEQLLLYYYADGLSTAERRRIEAALAADPALQRRYDALRSELDGLDDAPAVMPNAPADMVSRWHDSIDRAARLEQQAVRSPAGRLHFASFAWGTAVTAALALGIGFGVYFSGRNAPGVPADALPAVVDVAQPAAAADAFSRGLQAHFRESRQNIGGLPVEDSEARRALILDIVQQNRLFARAATDSQSPELARVLRSFEPVLLRLATEDLAPEEARGMQAQLMFELNVLLTKMNRAPSDRSESI